MSLINIVDAINKLTEGELAVLKQVLSSIKTDIAAANSTATLAIQWSQYSLKTQRNGSLPDGVIEPTYQTVDDFPIIFGNAASAAPTRSITFAYGAKAFLGYENDATGNPYLDINYVDNIGNTARNLAEIEVVNYRTMVNYYNMNKMNNEARLLPPWTNADIGKVLTINPSGLPAWLASTGGNPTKLNATVTLSSSKNPIVTGNDAFILTATITNGATGTITFKEGSTTIAANVSIVGTTASLTIPALPAISPGNHTYTAVYSGDTNYNAATSNVLTEQVNTVVGGTLDPTLSLVVIPNSNGNNNVQGTELTLIAYTQAVFNQPTVSGTVTFKDGSNIIGSMTLAAGTANIKTTALTVGVHNLTVHYNGDTKYRPSDSNTIIETITSGTLSLALSGLPYNTARANDPIHFRCDVTPSIATGVIRFTRQLQGSQYPYQLMPDITIANGTASYDCDPLQLPIGINNITAHYIPGVGSIYSAADSAPMAYTVTAAQYDPVITLTSDHPTSKVGDPVIFTCTIQNTHGVPTGEITIVENGTNIPGATALTLVNGSATYTTSSLSLGLHKFRIIYSGDTNYNYYSTYDICTENITDPDKTNTSMTLTTPSLSVNSATNFTLTAHFLTGSPTGTVTFYADNGVHRSVIGTGNIINSGGYNAILTISLADGTYTISAEFPADTNFNGCTAELSGPLVVGSATTELVITSNPTSTNTDQAGVRFNVTATPIPVGDNGTIRFYKSYGSVINEIITTVPISATNPTYIDLVVNGSGGNGLDYGSHIR